MALISIREYARQRGVSHNAVRKAIQSQRLVGSVVSSESGKKKIVLVDSEMADKEWPKGAQELVPTQPSNNRPELDEKQVQASATYQQARSVRENYGARLAKLEFDTRSGKLVDAEEVKKGWVNIVTMIRTKMLALPSKMKQRSPSFTPADYELLEAIVREALTDLAGNKKGE